MKTINTVIYTLDAIDSVDFARYFFGELENLNIEPSHISLVEPINISYSIEKAIELWSKQEDGCFDPRLKKSVGKAGGMLGKNRDYSITYGCRWWKCPERKTINYITCSISIAKYDKKKDEINELFRYLIKAINAVYGYIAHSDTIERQHETGRIEHRLPGMFWCNYFSKIYIDFIGRGKFEAKYWTKTEEMDNKGIIVFIDEHPYKRILEDILIEEKAKVFLGSDSFANPKEEELRKQDPIRWANEGPSKYKNVPKLL